jgi:uncharacterized protein YbcV (DUF1398 family)
MDTTVRDAILDASRSSDDESKSFGDIVRSLMAAGVERYHQDLVRNLRTYYLPNGESETVSSHEIGKSAAKSFSAEGVAAAVKGAQSGAVKYRAFCEQAVAAGCVGYIVSIAGKRVVYYGRTGDMHIEWFPGAKPN